MKHFFVNFFLRINMLTGYYQKKEDLQKASRSFWRKKIKKRQYTREQYKNLSEKKSTEKVNMFASGMKIFLKIKTKVSWV